MLLPDVRDAVAAREIAQRVRAAIEAAVLRRRHPDRPRGQHRHRPRAGPRHRLRAAAPARRRRDVRRQGRAAPASRSTPPTRDTNSPDRLGLLGALRRAIDDGELELHYQPKVARRGRHRRRCRGAGALAPPDARPGAAGRVHPARRAVGPDAPADRPASSTWRWPRSPSGARDGLRVPVAVNVSMRDLQDRAFADAARPARLRRLRRAGRPALILEITERVLMADVAGRLRHPRRARCARRAAQPRRLRHRLLLAGAAQAAAGAARSRSTARS